VTADLRDLAPGAPRGRPVQFTFEGETLAAFQGEPLAVALHAAGVDTLARSTKYHRPRGFFCLDGHCASCLMRIDGRPNQRACRTVVREDLRCERQNAFPSADVDVLAAADWLFPEGMDHHTMMTGTRAGNALFLRLVREMGGSGTLPDAPAAVRTAHVDRAADLCIVGGGPAGLAAARAAAEAAPGRRIVLYDEQAELGGSLLAEPGGLARAAELAAAARAAGAELVSGASAIGFYPEDNQTGTLGGFPEPPATTPPGEAQRSQRAAGLLAVVAGDRLVRVSARRFLYATGAYDQNLPFPDNDRPGVVSARACGRLAFRWGVRPVGPRRRVIVLSGAPHGVTLARGLEAAGVACELVDLTRETVVAARGARRIRGLDLEASGSRRTVTGDMVAVATLPAPASELPRQHGVPVAFDPARGGFAALADAEGATPVAGVFAAGDVTGYGGPEAAARAGARAGKAAGSALAALAMLLAVGLGLACGGCAAPPPPPVEAPPAAAGAPEHPVEPPPFSAAAPATRDTAATAQTELRRSIVDAAWRTVRDNHFDKTLGGLDWNAVRAKYEPLALGAPSDAAFYRVLNQMIGELGQSHMMITGPGDEDENDAEEVAAAGDAPARAPVPASDAIGDPGLTVRVIEGRPTITRVQAGSTADHLGLRPGFVVTEIGGRPLTAAHPSARPLRPVEERFALRRAAARRLAGPPGTRVTLSYLDDQNRPGKVVLVRDPPRSEPMHFGHLSALYPEVRAYEVGDVGVVAFNIFILDPVLNDVKKAIARFQSHHVRAIVLDLRGNPGGVGAMSIPVASLFVDKPLTLGTLKFRDFSQTFVAKPEMGETPFLGPLAILTDEGTASTSEMLTAGLQEGKRAIVVGDATLGAVLPSVVASLPGGAVIQYVVADFKTPKGALLEGRGVQPDRRVLETRAGLRSGRDPVLDAALVAVRASRAP
jgi:sarcosine oxidase subunit alpha